MRGIEGPFTQSSAENERCHHAFPYLFIRGGDRGEEARVERRRRRRRENRQQPPLGVGVGVGDATGGFAPPASPSSFKRAPFSLHPVHATAPPAALQAPWLVLCVRTLSLSPCAARNPYPIRRLSPSPPSVRHPFVDATTARIRESAQHNRGGGRAQMPAVLVYETRLLDAAD